MPDEQEDRSRDDFAERGADIKGETEEKFYNIHILIKILNSYYTVALCTFALMEKKALEIFRAEVNSELSLPIADEGIKAGFPSPAQDFMDLAIDLNKELVRHPASTFYGRVRGDSMQDAGVYDGDILIIDKSLEPRNGDMAVCFVDGEFTIKYIKIEKDIVWLIPANDSYSPIKVTEDNDFLIWGIVTYSIKKQR